MFECRDESCRCKTGIVPPKTPSKSSEGWSTASSAAQSLDSVPASPALSADATGAGSDSEPEAVPAKNFGIVQDGVLYRSAFPTIANLEYARHLGVRTVIALTPEEYPASSRRYLERHGIRFIQVGMPGHKEAFAETSGELVHRVLGHILNPENYPILLHCNRGKHRTGTVVGCLRQCQGWSDEDVIDEYRTYAHPKERDADIQYMRNFEIPAQYETKALEAGSVGDKALGSGGNEAKALAADAESEDGGSDTASALHCRHQSAPPSTARFLPPSAMIERPSSRGVTVSTRS